MEEAKSFSGRTALVTGGGRGIGRAVCIRLAKEGADIIINYAGRDDAAKETAALCEAYGVKTKLIKADVSDRAACEEMFKEAKEWNGRIDILVNNAGITKDQILLRMKEEDFARVIEVNLMGSFHCMQLAGKIMLKQKFGRIINMSSVVGLRGNPGQMNYAASKAGVIGMTKTMAKELAAKNITVNAIAPGFIETDILNDMTDKAKEDMTAPIPAKRLGQPEEVAEAVAFFANPDNAYITGQVLCVDGGMAV